MKKKMYWSAGGVVAGLALTSLALAFDAKHNPIIPNLPASPTLTVSTIPPNGDVNPYGVAFVPASFPKGGTVNPGDILVSNFNDAANLQGTGTTIVRVPPSGQTSVFFQGRNLGLTTALGASKLGFVFVGDMPTTDGTCGTARPGSLIIINRNGKIVGRIQGVPVIDGPWDLALVDHSAETIVFLSNVLSGTVIRLAFVPSSDGSTVSLQNHVQIASGYTHRCDPAALVIGPTGLAYDAMKDILYVASTGDNAIYSIKNAISRGPTDGIGTLVYSDPVHLHGPLGLVLTPNGDLISTQGDAVNPDPSQPSEMVEFTTAGVFVAERSVDPSGLGGAFGIAITSSSNTTRLAAVDDIQNTLDVWTIR